MKIKSLLLTIIAFCGILFAYGQEKRVAPDGIAPLPGNQNSVFFKKGVTGQSDFSFPDQKKPVRIIVCNVNYGNPGEAMLAQSVSGLAAQAVNNGTYDALVWINNVGWGGDVLASFNKWFAMAKTRMDITNVQTVALWDIVDQLKSDDIVKGYVLYRLDVSAGQPYKSRAGLNHSANMATTAAGVMKGLMISEDLESQAIAHGLTKLIDVRNQSYTAIYQHFKDSLNTNMAMHVDPQYPNHRGMAVAFRNNVFFGSQVYNQFMSVLNPGSPVFGWGADNEVTYTTALSNYGLFNVASNWCDNLLVTSADAHNYQPQKVKTLNPRMIDFSGPGSFFSFIMSDGDNLQWMQRGFFVDEKYWANPAHGDFPMGWTSCMATLAETVPDAMDYMAATQPAHTSVIEAEGGYNYPDQFGLSTPDRLQTIRDFAKKLNVRMKRTGARILEFICLDINSQAAKDAYQIYAEEIENLTGMVVLEFSTGYEGSNGEIFWPTNKEGVHIPVVGSKYALWDSLPASYTRSGGPTKLAGIINADANVAQQNDTQSMNWAVAMAWSKSTQNGVTAQGLTPVSWCVDKLNSNVNVVSPEELLWRIRMKYYPEETNAAMLDFPAPSQEVLYLDNRSELTITPGATVTVQGGINAADGSSILNNGKLTLTSNSLTSQSNWTDANPTGVFAAGSSGEVYFKGDKEQVITGNTTFPSLTMDAPGDAILANDISIGQNLRLKNGKLNTGAYKILVNDNDPDAVLADATNTNYVNSWINGNLERSVTANTGTYDFPVGNSERPNLLQFVNNNVSGPASLTVSFGDKRGTDAGLVVSENGMPYVSVNEGGVWYLNADAAATGGNYALQLYFNGFTGLADNQFGILRRGDSSSSAVEWVVPEGSLLESINGNGRKVSDGYARRKNIATFSQLGIGSTAGVVPVRLLNFFATRENKTWVKLDWETASEANNKGFEIERKLENGTAFAYVGFESSKAIGGNSQTRLHYRYRDDNSFSGITYYRIKQIDLDNHYVYTGIKAVKGMGDAMVEVSIMPNPNIGQFKILISGVSQSYTAFITDLSGKIMKQLKVHPEQNVNVRGLAPATYILTIKDVFGKGKNFSEKIIIVP